FAMKNYLFGLLLLVDGVRQSLRASTYLAALRSSKIQSLLETGIFVLAHDFSVDLIHVSHLNVGVGFGPHGIGLGDRISVHVALGGPDDGFVQIEFHDVSLMIK